MRVAIIYNEPVKGMPDSEDVLSEVSLVADAITDMGYEYMTCRINCETSIFSITDIIRELGRYAPSVIFNLVEGVGKDQRLSASVAAVFELIGYPYTGSPYEVISITTDKAITKAILSGEGVLTPGWAVFKEGMHVNVNNYESLIPAILKPVNEDASVGIDEDSVISDINNLMKRLDYMLKRFQQPVLIEEYIDGREFNISLLEHPDGGVEVLPVAEIVFSDWHEERPRIVSYRAKWDNSSFEYKNTPRRFNPEDAPVRRIKEIAIKCWHVFNLRGYARVDMRMDRDGNLYVIEVNANPCISHDAGFMASACEAGYKVKDVIGMILSIAINKYEHIGQ